MVVADTLSRAPGEATLEKENKVLNEEVTAYVAGIYGNLPIRNTQMDRIAEAQKKDEETRKII